jgi:phosphoribosylformylglycinamidine synthase subunit PurL
VLRIGVTDAGQDGASPALEIQDLFTVDLEELRSVHRGTLPAHFGARVTQ